MSNQVLPDERPDLPLPTKDCTGKTVIVTGANTGVGKEAATHFARLSAAHIILASRNVENCKDAVEQAQNAATGKDAKAECWQLDLSDFKSVKAFVEAAKKLERLDILLMNAAVAHPQRIETVDGFDTVYVSTPPIDHTPLKLTPADSPSLQVNGLSTAFISSQLLPLLESTASKFPDEKFKPHLTLVTSGNVLRSTKEAFEPEEGKGIVESMNDVGTDRSEKEYLFQVRYGIQTKGFNAMNAYTLAQKASSEVVVNCVCPGFVVTSLSRHAPEELKERARYATHLTYSLFALTDRHRFSSPLQFPGISALYEKIGLQPEQGARNVVWASTEITPPGAFIQHCAVNEHPDGFVFTEEGHEVATRIWKEFEEIWKEKGLI